MHIYHGDAAVQATHGQPCHAVPHLHMYPGAFFNMLCSGPEHDCALKMRRLVFATSFRLCSTHSASSGIDQGVGTCAPLQQRCALQQACSALALRSCTSTPPTCSGRP